jgi:hypothetical protein
LTARTYAPHLDPSATSAEFFGLLDRKNTVATTFANMTGPGNYAPGLWQLQIGPDGNLYAGYWAGLDPLDPSSVLKIKLVNSGQRRSNSNPLADGCRKDLPRPIFNGSHFLDQPWQSYPG